jgi:hypothetical protein
VTVTLGHHHPYLYGHLGRRDRQDHFYFCHATKGDQAKYSSDGLVSLSLTVLQANFANVNDPLHCQFCDVTMLINRKNAPISVKSQIVEYHGNL